MNIIRHLKTQQLVHIISEPRSGSNSLYDCLSAPEQTMKLKTKFFKHNYPSMNEPVKKDNKQMFRDNVRALCEYVYNNPERCRVIKNHLEDILELDAESQQMLWDIPAYKVGLTRRNVFEQSCSLALAKQTKIYHPSEGSTQPVHVDPDLYVKHLKHVIKGKRLMLKHKNRFDMWLCYEDIHFPQRISRGKSMPKSDTILNMQQLRDLYEANKA